ncbi:MAG TPA: abortive infection family protein [Puia sp.]|nr:abortive infection family protein [Puia sp.]
MPLYDDLLKIGFVSFVKTNDFLRLLNDMGLDEIWARANDQHMRERSSRKTNSFLDIFDSETNYDELLGFLLNILFDERRDQFLEIISEFIIQFFRWTKEYFVIEDLLKDLVSLGITSELKTKVNKEWQQIEDDVFRKVILLKEFVTAIATGGTWDDKKYQLLRQPLLKKPEIKRLLPDLIRNSHTLSEFWPAIQSFGGYRDRRFFLQKAFAPLMEKFQENEIVIADAVIITEGYINEIWNKALERMLTDPEAAITSARTLIETVCKHILDSFGEQYDETVDLPRLYKTAAAKLNLSPDQHSETAFKQILKGASAIVDGLASLRNRLSDAHGRRVTNARPSMRHAALAVNLAGAMSLFLLESLSAIQEKAKQTP